MTLSSCCAPLSFLVSHVFRVCAQEQMVNIDASRRIAPVQDMHPFRNITALHRPKQARYTALLSIMRNTRIIFARRAVADPSSPYVAPRVRHHKPICNSVSKSGAMLAFSAAKLMATCIKATLSHCHHLPTVLTRRFYVAFVHAGGVAGVRAEFGHSIAVLAGGGGRAALGACERNIHEVSMPLWSRLRKSRAAGRDWYRARYNELEGD